MITGKSSLEGYRPELRIGSGNPEAIKYGKMWELPEYRMVAPGETWFQIFLQQARPKPGSEIIDFGCGTGRGALMLALVGQMKVTMVDFVNNSLDPEIRQCLTTQAHAMKFLKHDLEVPIPINAEYGFCTDTMEHIPPDKVDKVLDNILKSAQHVFFSIATLDDVCGKLIGETLHLTLHPYEWWLKKFQARDCVVHWSQNMQEQGTCLFYVTAWQDGLEVVNIGKLNVGADEIKANVRHNCSQGWMQVEPHETNDIEAMIIGGGPSVDGFESEIKLKRAEGVKLITLNGAYNWSLTRGLSPSAQIVVDAREFNARFTKPVVEDCRYLIASQCHPAVLDGLPKDRTYLWHTTAESISDILNEHYKVWWGIPGGSTVLLRAIPLMRMLGYRKFHLYGCDSCLSETAISDTVKALRHHAYQQAENDDEATVPVKVTGGRMFLCHPWMLAQAQEMIGLIKYMGDEIELEIHGDGLLKHIIEVGASFSIEGGE